jgi:hypothetical protein
MSIDFQLPIKEGEEVDFVSLFVGNRIWQQQHKD